MKKKLIALFLMVILLFTVGGCNLFTVDVEKDYARTVAAVGITDDAGNTLYQDNITKLQLVNVINNQYESLTSQGYDTPRAVTEYVLNALMERRVIIQEAVIYVMNNQPEGTVTVFGSGEPTQAEKAQAFNFYLKGLTGEVAVDAEADFAAAATNLIALSADYRYTEDDLRFALLHEAVNTINDSIISQLETYEDSVKTRWDVIEDDSADDEETENDDDYILGSATNSESRPVREEAQQDEPVTITLPEDVAAGDEANLLENYDQIPLYTGHISDELNIETKSGEMVSERMIREGAIESMMATLQTNDYTYDEYYSEQLVSYLESSLVTRYQQLLDSSLNTITWEALTDRFDAIQFGEQQSYDISTDTYVTNLTSVGDSTFVTYHPVSGYGYVQHILIQFDDAQSAQITAAGASGLTEAERLALRAALLEQITVRSLSEFQTQGEITYRLTGDTEDSTVKYAQYDEIWAVLEALQDYETDGKVFTKLVFTKIDEGEREELLNLDEAALTEKPLDANLTEYHNTLAEAEGHPVSSLGADVSIADFCAAFESAFGLTAGSLWQNYEYYASNDPDHLNDTLSSSTISDLHELMNLFTDWIFLFNEDSGIFNNNTGYLSQPAVDIGETETYMTEFADAARAVVDAGPGAMKLVATDYGFHLVLCTEKITVGSENLNQAVYELMTRDNSTLTEEELLTKQNASNTVTYKLYNIMLTENQNKAYTDLVQAARDDYFNDQNNRFTTTYEWRYSEFLID